MSQENKAERQVEYLIESGAVFLTKKGKRGLTRLLPGDTIKLTPRVAKRLLLNKGRPMSVVLADRAAESAAAKAREEAEAEALPEK